MITQGGLKAASTNRPLEAVRRLLRWAEATGAVAREVALHVKSVRIVRDRQPHGLTGAEVHGLLRAAGESSHGCARRNHSLVQPMLQTGVRVGEARHGLARSQGSTHAPDTERHGSDRMPDRAADLQPQRVRLADRLWAQARIPVAHHCEIRVAVDCLGENRLAQSADHQQRLGPVAQGLTEFSEA